MGAFFSWLSELALRLFPLFVPKGEGARGRVALLVISNLLPILGVLFFHWNPILLMLVYWMESAAIGFFNVPRMVLSGAVESNGHFSVLGLIGGLFLGGFFTFHYGMFMLVHLVFLFVAAMIGHVFPFPTEDPLKLAAWFWASQSEAALGFFENPLGFLVTPLFAGILIFISTGIGVWQDFIKTKAYRPLGADACMFEPYPRVFVMHLTLLFGAIPLMILKVPAGAMAVFVLLKIIAEVKAINKAKEKRLAKEAREAEAVSRIP